MCSVFNVIINDINKKETFSSDIFRNLIHFNTHVLNVFILTFQTHSILSNLHTPDAPARIISI